MAFTKVGPKFQVTIPKATRDAVGLDIGDVVEATVQGNKIILRPKIVVDKHPEIEARLREAEEDIKAGRVYGPFRSAKELVRDLHKRTKAAKARKTKNAR
jgi:AbrB family looped-hinge helix DNA binding protein